jgi:hypothetical protein
LSVYEISTTQILLYALSFTCIPSILSTRIHPALAIIVRVSLSATIPSSTNTNNGENNSIALERSCSINCSHFGRSQDRVPLCTKLQRDHRHVVCHWSHMLTAPYSNTARTPRICWHHTIPLHRTPTDTKKHPAALHMDHTRYNIIQHLQPAPTFEHQRRQLEQTISPNTQWTNHAAESHHLLHSVDHVGLHVQLGSRREQTLPLPDGRVVHVQRHGWWR